TLQILLSLYLTWLPSNVSCLRTYLKIHYLGILNGVTQCATKPARGRLQTNTAAGAYQPWSAASQVGPPPVFNKEKSGDLHMMRFMSKQVTSILKQRPEIFKAGFQGAR